jgi:hypothetical protein
MKSSFNETLITVWRQALVDEADVVKLGSERHSRFDENTSVNNKAA